MKIKINQLLNSSILNDEMVGFQGDSEYLDETGNLQLGAWSFIGITDDSQEEIPFDLDDEIEEEVLYNDELIIIIKNKHDHICMVKFHYRRE